MGRVVDQIVAIQVGNDLDAPREDFLVEPADHGVNSFQSGCRIRSFAHEDDALDHIVVVYHHAIRAVNGLPDLPETDLGSLRDDRDVADPQGRAVLRFDHGLVDVLNVAD